jgi:hypothetical protein
MIGDTQAPVNDQGSMAGKKPLPQNDSVSCPCCGQSTTKQALQQNIDSLPSSQPNTPGMSGSPDSGMDSMPDESSMAKQYA